MDSGIASQEMASFLGKKLHGCNISITGVSSIANLHPNTLVFANKAKLIDKINKKALVIVPIGSCESHERVFSYIEHENPRLAFAFLATRFFVEKRRVMIHPTTILGERVKIGTNVAIGCYCVIGDDVSIGDNTIINNNVVIASGTLLGCKCYIKSGSIIGEDGFGFERDQNNVPIRIPQLGKVIIGDSVEIGAKCTIARGTIDNTIIENNVKIDDQVHVAHNVFIGEGTIITGCAEISGGVKIGRFCWLAPGCSIIQKKIIGDHSMIGIGAVVLNDVKADTVVFGNPATLLRFKDN